MIIPKLIKKNDLPGPATEAFTSESPIGSCHRGGTFKIVQLGNYVKNASKVNRFFCCLKTGTTASKDLFCSD